MTVISCDCVGKLNFKFEAGPEIEFDFVDLKINDIV